MELMMELHFQQPVIILTSTPHSEIAYSLITIMGLQYELAHG